ncbi:MULTISPECIES: NAD(P)H-binding protein [Levilactobacillus]|uniref:NAD(P)H-binding protein n=1 Tax=Levilactobacillus TaxID=2767886 RepID=UPI000F78F050|nr:NAD(P)H-binding protein [Levilactobacillus cerevisiae]
MKILVLGAAGQISRYLTDLLLNETTDELVLYGRNMTTRLNQYAANDRVTLINGDFADEAALTAAAKGVDAAYLNHMHLTSDVQNVVKALDANHVTKLIGANILGIYGEVPGKFGQWNLSMVGGQAGEDAMLASAEVMEDSDLADYTVLRLTWLFNQAGNENYELIPKGQPFKNAQVSRQAVARGIATILHDASGQYSRQSFGIGEPDTYFDKPSFY